MRLGFIEICERRTRRKSKTFLQMLTIEIQQCSLQQPSNLIHVRMLGSADKPNSQGLHHMFFRPRIYNLGINASRSLALPNQSSHRAYQYCIFLIWMLISKRLLPNYQLKPKIHKHQTWKLKSPIHHH